MTIEETILTWHAKNMPDDGGKVARQLIDHMNQVIDKMPENLRDLAVEHVLVTLRESDGPSYLHLVVGAWQGLFGPYPV